MACTQNFFIVQAMQDIFYISNIKGIKALSSNRRLKILRYLVDKEYTAQELSEIFQVKQNALWYDMEQLKQVGVIKLIRKEKVRGTVKKYYRAIARNYFVDISLGTASLSNNYIHNLINQELEDWRRENIIRISFEDLANKIINNNLNIIENEVVVISYQPMHQKLVEDLVVEINKKGAYPIPIFWSQRMEYNLIKNVPTNYISKDVIDDFLLDKIDAHIIFSTEFLKDENYEYSDEMIEKTDLIEEKKRENIRKTYNTQVRFLTIDTMPNISKLNNETAKQREMYWKSLYTPIERIKEECNYVKKRIQSGHIIEIENCNNKLEIHLPVDKKIEIIDGYADQKSADSELPAGMVVNLLDKARVTGNINTDFVYIFDQKYDNVNIKIKNSKIVEFNGNKKIEIQKLFDSAEGDKDIIGSFCIGLNPELSKNINHQYINTKIYGSVSLQVGWDELEKSNIDSNMISQFFILNSNILVDHKLLFKKGKLIK